MRRVLQRWLSLFHVRHRPEVLQQLYSLARDGAAGLRERVDRKRRSLATRRDGRKTVPGIVLVAAAAAGLALVLW